MRHPSAGIQARHGILVVLNGIAIWLLAVILSTYASSTPVSVADGNLVQYAGAIMGAWLQQPAVGMFELAAYVGLSIAVIGPIWFWVVRPLRELSGRDTDESELGQGDAPMDFVFSEDLPGEDSVTKRFESNPITTGYQRFVRESRHGRSNEWTSVLFTPTDAQASLQRVPVPEGDFLRSSGGRDPATGDESGDDVASGDPVAKAQFRAGKETTEASERDSGGTLADVVITNGGSGVEEAPEESEQIERNDVEEPVRSDPVDISEAVQTESAVDEDSFDGPVRTVTDEAVPVRVELADKQANPEESVPTEPDEVEEPTQTEISDPGERPDAGPEDPTEALSTAVSEAREKTDAVSGALMNGHDDTRDDAGAAISDIRESAHASLRAVRGELPDESRSFQDDIEALFADQRQIESAFSGLADD